jgi:hypothetical protein
LSIWLYGLVYGYKFYTISLNYWLYMLRQSSALYVYM